MKLRQLEYFCAVAEEKSISAAARELHVAQPPISRQIAQLEEELGVRLFLRGSKGMSLTDAGQSLYQQTQQIFQDIRRVEDSVRSVGTGMSGRIKLGVIYSAMSYALHYINEYHSRYPQVELFIRVGSPQELIESLNRGELHALFLRTAAREPSGLQERILGEDKLELIMREDLDPAPELSEVPIERLRGCADVPSAFGRPVELQRLFGAGVPAQRLYAECDLPLLRYAHGDADGALGLWHQLSAKVHPEHASGRTLKGKARARSADPLICRFGMEQRGAQRPVCATLCRGEDDLKKLSPH